MNLETGTSSLFPAQVGLQALVGLDTLASRAEGIPRGAGQSTELPGPRSPPLPRIVLAPEQSQGGHLIPACGGSWLSPRPFDWAAVMRERQLRGRGRKGQPPSLTQLSPPPPPPPAGVAGSQGQKEWALNVVGGLESRRERLRSEAWSKLGMFCQGALLTRGGWAPPEVSWRSVRLDARLPCGWPSRDPGSTHPPGWSSK